MIMNQIYETLNSDTIDLNEFKFFLTDKLKRSVNIDQGVQTLKALMENVKTEGPIIFLPDFTPAKSGRTTKYLEKQETCLYSTIASKIKKVVKNIMIFIISL